MPRTPAGISGTPDVPGQPYDATADGTVGKWVSVDSGSGPASFETGQATGDFPSDGVWKQT